MMSLWDALRMNMMISYQELVRTFPKSSLRSPDLSRNVSTLFRTGHIFEIKLNGADFFFFSKHVSSPESPGNRPHPHYCLISLALTAILLSLEDA